MSHEDCLYNANINPQSKARHTCVRVEHCESYSLLNAARASCRFLLIPAAITVLLFSICAAASAQTPASNLSCATPSDGTFDATCAYIDTNHAMWGVRISALTGRETFQWLSGFLVGNPSCASANDSQQPPTGEVICAAKGSDGNLYATRVNPAVNLSPSYEGLPYFSPASDPSCASPGDQTGQVICAVKGVDNGLYAARLDAHSYYSSYQPLGGPVFGSPSCAGTNDGSGQVTCAVVAGGSNGTEALWAIRINPNTMYRMPTIGYQGLGGVILPGTNPSCASANELGRINCGVIGGTTGNIGPLFGITLDPNTGYSSGFPTFNGSEVFGSPGCASDKVGTFCVVTGGAYGPQNDNLYAYPFSATGFAGGFQHLNVLSTNNSVSCAGTGDGNFVVCGSETQQQPGGLLIPVFVAIFTGPVYTVSPSGDQTGGEDTQSIAAALEQCAGAASGTQLCEVQLTPGAYYLNKGLQVPNNSTLMSSTSVRSDVTLARAGQSTFPMITLGALPGSPTVNTTCQSASPVAACNVRLENVTIYGQTNYLQSTSPSPSTGVNVVVRACGNCVVNNVDSSRATGVSVIAANDVLIPNTKLPMPNTNLTVENSYIHDNGWPIASSTNYKSDGLDVLTVNGHSFVTNNTFNNNTDIDFILVGGMSAGSTITVEYNYVQQHSLEQMCSNPPPNTPACGSAYTPTGAGMMFDTQPGWCDNGGTLTCNDFTGFAVHNNVVQCGPDCGYPMGVGTHMASNWNSTLQALGAVNLTVDSSNATDRITVDFAGSGSQIGPTVTQANSCSYGMLTTYGAVTIPCRPCTGSSISQNPPPTYRGIWMPMCDEAEDAGFNPSAVSSNYFHFDGKTDSPALRVFNVQLVPPIQQYPSMDVAEMLPSRVLLPRHDPNRSRSNTVHLKNSFHAILF